MWRDLLVAMGVAALWGLLALIYDRYVFWRAYARDRFGKGLAIFVAVNALSGAFGVGAAAVLNWEPRPGLWAFNGAIYGLVGQGVIRIEPRSPELRDLEKGRSILARATDFVVRYLDAGAEVGIQARLDRLSDQELLDQALYLRGKWVARDPAVARQAALQQKKYILDAAELLTRGTRAEGRGMLERYCLREITDRQLPPAGAWTPPLADGSGEDGASARAGAAAEPAPSG
jgi:hypothetical protein